MLEHGPFRSAVEAEKQGILKEEYVVYKVHNGYLVKETFVRDHKGEDYHDTSTHTPLVEVK